MVDGGSGQGKPEGLALWRCNLCPQPILQQIHASGAVQCREAKMVLHLGHHSQPVVWVEQHWFNQKNLCAASSSSDVELRLRSAIHTHLATWHELVLSTVSPQSIDRAALKLEGVGYPGYYGYQGALRLHFTLVHWQQAILNHLVRLSSLSRCLSALKLLRSSSLELCVMCVSASHFIWFVLVFAVLAGRQATTLTKSTLRWLLPRALGCATQTLIQVVKPEEFHTWVSSEFLKHSPSHSFLDLQAIQAAQLQARAKAAGTKSSERTAKGQQK